MMGMQRTHAVLADARRGHVREPSTDSLLLVRRALSLNRNALTSLPLGIFDALTSLTCVGEGGGRDAGVRNDMQMIFVCVCRVCMRTHAYTHTPSNTAMRVHRVATPIHEGGE